MKKLVRKLIVLGMVLGALGQYTAHAQQDPLYTQYMYNTSVFNPAYAGNRGNISIFGQYRAQWVGLEGAPKTAAFNINGPIGETGLGAGLSFVNDNLGAMNRNDIMLDLSYTIDLNIDYKLSFGIKGSGSFIDIDYTKLDFYDPKDPYYGQKISGKFKANIGAGLYLYSDRTYVGISVPQFLSEPLRMGEDDRVFEEKMHFYLMGGHVFELSRSVDFKPSAIIKAVSGAPLEVDVSANFLFNQKITAGLAYRWDASISGLVGYQLNDGLFIGYSYDASTSRLSRYNSGSHEVFLRFDLLSKHRKYDAPRFF